MQNVVCCNHTRVKYVAITWARCTRVAAVRAPEGSCTGPTETVGCVCAVCARLSRRRAAQVRAFARRKSAIGPADLNRSQGDSVKCKQSNPSRSEVVKARCGCRKQAELSVDCWAMPQSALP
jgi:hypothetical protein